MKSRRPHAVPLSKQVIGYLKELAEMVGTEGYVFPSARASVRPMSENTLNAAFPPDGLHEGRSHRSWLAGNRLHHAE
jgi:integrase